MRTLMVSPQNMDVVLGELEGVEQSSVRLSFSYYSNTRTNGKMEYIGDGWVRGSFIRFEEDGREIGTYAVVDESSEIRNGAVHHSLELRSALHLLETDIADQPWLIGKGQSVKAAVDQLMKSCSRPCKNDGNDYTLRTPTVYESGDSQLKRLFSLCDMANNRVDVNAHGLVTIKPYVEPYRRSSSFEIDLADTAGAALDGISFATDYLSLPNRVSVVYRYSENVNGESVNKEVYGRADASGNLARQTRGYVVSDFRVVDELNPPTAARAREMADDIMKKVGEQVEWKVRLVGAPITAGDVVDLVVDNGPSGYVGRRKCLVKNMDLDMQFMNQTVTLKEV